jgi:UDP-glucose 4-epimerase
VSGRTHRRALTLVWGARGFIGTHLVAALLERREHVRILSRSAAGTDPAWEQQVEWVQFDPGEPATAFERAVDGAQVIFNLAGSSGAVASNASPIDSLDSNCRLQLEFLDACARRRATPHVVFASSRLVYAQGGLEPVTEQHPLAPRSMYGAHKLCVEHYHRIYAERDAITCTICRISNPYGLDESAPGRGYGFINTMIQRALAGQPLVLFGSGAQLRDYLFVDDLVAMLRLCAERTEAINATFNVALGRSLPMRDAALLMCERLGGGPIEFRPWPREYQLVESGDFVADTTTLRARLGDVPQYSVDRGLAEIRERAARRFARAVTLAFPRPFDTITAAPRPVVTRG